MHSKIVRMLYGKTGLELQVPQSAVLLESQDIRVLTQPEKAVIKALESPIGITSLADLIASKKPKTVAITISDITRPVPNRVFLQPMLEYLKNCRIRDEQILIVIGTGMHRPSTVEEKKILVGSEILSRVEVIDHRADYSETLLQLSEDPPVHLNRRFAEADFKIVTGYIEPHFMAGFSGGRKGVCPALVDLKTIQRFHGFETLANPKADNGILDGNPCHEIALKVARTAEVDFLFNVVLTREREVAGIYCGDLEEAHLAGCRQAAEWTTAEFDSPFDLVITTGGGFPLDLTFYQTVKGMCTALPALHSKSTLLQVSDCKEQLGSQAYTDLMLRYSDNWRKFLVDIEANKLETRLDQWELQMQCRVLDLLGQERLWFVSDGIPPEIQQKICVTPILGRGDAQERAQRAVDEYLHTNSGARVTVVPDGPYTMLRQTHF